jgi:hypothetical protein
MRGVLEQVTLAAIARGELPEHVTALIGSDESWVTRPSPAGGRS